MGAISSVGDKVGLEGKLTRQHTNVHTSRMSARVSTLETRVLEKLEAVLAKRPRGTCRILTEDEELAIAAWHDAQPVNMKKMNKMPNMKTTYFKM